MAKLFGPLHSDDARGKLASSLVFIGWKGIKTVRAYVKPANPQTAAQGNIRTITGGNGRAAGKVGVDSEYHVQMKTLELIPDQQSKQSWIVQQLKDLFFAGSGATMTASYVAQLAEFTGVTSVAIWRTAASELAIADFSLPYDSIADYDKGMGLYLIAKLSIANGFTGSPYTKTLTSWTATQIALFTADLAAA
jgi:hypothetical protein